ncbi:hypothetical protein [Amycolatopsis sp. NPDC049868]|uniref:hypothetical protein n=1 Tax=Amycolatopsis sp. NPDC049868 TaxID=3363934 RepID=UPI00379D74D0
MPTSDLNTNVNGSVVMCRDAAAQLKANGDHAAKAMDHYVNSRNQADRAWGGPAHDAFSDAVTDAMDPLLDLAYTAMLYARALDEFANALEGVNNTMDIVLAKATAGGLLVEGPIVYRPDNPGTPPELIVMQLSPPEAKEAFKALPFAITAYKQLVVEYNRKVDVFNDCLAIFTDARHREKEAHQLLLSVFKPTKNANFDAWKIGKTTVSAVLGRIGAAENMRHDATIRAERLLDNAIGYQQLADGQLPSIERSRNLIKASMANRGSQRELAKIDSLSKLLDNIPEQVRASAAAYPGRGNPHIAVPLTDATFGGKATSVILKRLPYIGAGLTVGTELFHAATGEQTWGKAVAKSAGIITGGAAGAQAGAVIGGVVAGMPGAIIGGGIGGIVGGFAGGAVVDYYVPDEKPAPTTMTKIQYGS